MTTVPTSPASGFDFDEHRRSAVEAFQRVRPLYEAFAGDIKDILDHALGAAWIKTASVQARAKSLQSFADKAGQASEIAPETPKYSAPMSEITDLAAARVITFFLDTIDEVDGIIRREFDVLERLDKSDLLVQEERLGYQRRSLYGSAEGQPNDLARVFPLFRTPGGDPIAYCSSTRMGRD